jgi:hypothetical protein
MFLHFLLTFLFRALMTLFLLGFGLGGGDELDIIATFKVIDGA